MVTACGGGAASPAPSPSPTPDPLTADQVMERAVDAVASTSAFRFEMTHRRGATLLTNGVTVEKAVGSAVVPDRYELEADTRLGNVFLKTRVIVLADTTYMYNPLARRWDQLPPEESPFHFFNPSRLVADIMGQVQNPALGDPARTSAGEYVVTGSLPATALRPLTGEVDEEAVLQVRIILDGAAFRPIRTELEGRATPLEGADVSRVITLSGFNEHIEINPPATQ